jgi:aspartyl-tRNA(Asn)/glutamyl-tRNA(Gln) amidotransferase subunit C
MEKKITKQDIERVASIARLSPSQEELDGLTADANAILEYFSLIDEIPDAVTPQTYVLSHDNALRKDEEKKTDPAGIRRGFGRKQDNYMLAPKSF